MNPADLGKIFEMNPGAFWQAQGMLRQSSQGADLENQRKAVELAQLQQMNPLKLQQQQLQNRGFELGNIMDEERLPGVRADAQGRARQWEVESQIPVEKQLQAKLGELATKMSEDEWKQTEAGIKKLMVSPSAEERRIGELLYKHMPKMVEQRQAQQSKEDIEALKVTARKEEAERSRAARMAQIERQAELRMREAKTKGDPKNFQAAATYYMQRAIEADSDEERLKFTSLARMFEASAQELANARSAGQVDAGAAAGLPTRKASPKLGTEADKPDPLGIR